MTITAAQIADINRGDLNTLATTLRDVAFGTLLGQLANNALAGVPDVVAAGALSVATRTTAINVSGTKAYTLANGTFVGQRKTVYCRTAASTPVGVLTPASVGAGYATLTFGAAAESVELEWDGSAWQLVGVSGSVTIA